MFIKTLHTMMLLAGLGVAVALPVRHYTRPTAPAEEVISILETDDDPIYRFLSEEVEDGQIEMDPGALRSAMGSYTGKVALADGSQRWLEILENGAQPRDGNMRGWNPDYKAPEQKGYQARASIGRDLTALGRGRRSMFERSHFYDMMGSNFNRGRRYGGYGSGYRGGNGYGSGSGYGNYGGSYYRR